jgi:phenylacetate-CoA ligase
MSALKGRPQAVGLWGHLLYQPSLRNLARHPVLSELRRLEGEQWLSSEEDHQLQQSRLLAVLTSALSSVPYYRRSLGITAGKAAALDLPDDFAAWPILTRSCLAEARDELVSSGPLPRGCQWNHTGGSTGEPVSFLQEDAYRVVNLAATARHDRWAGWDFGLPVALLWGADQDLAAAGNWRSRLETRWLRRQVEMDAFEMSEERMAAFSERLGSLRPVVIRGYAAALDIFARHLEGRRRPFPSPAGVISCAETLTDGMRQRLENVFGCPVLDRYGSREFGLIASQCAAGKYHVNSRGVHVEILSGGQPARPGEAGRVIVTGLVGKAMPLIRYDTGDVAEAATETTCFCGRGLPLMGRIHGRVSDFVVTPDGRMVHGEFFTHLFYGRRHVRGFALSQDDGGRLQLQVTGDGEGLEEELRQVAAAIRERLGDRVPLEIRRVEALPVAPSGKRCFVRSRLAARRWEDGDVQSAGGTS